MARRCAAFLPLLIATSLCSCSSDESSEGSTSPPPDAGASDATSSDGTVQDTSSSPDATEAGPDAHDDAGWDTGTIDAGPDATQSASEEEPNDGTTLDEYNELPLGVRMVGTIGTPGDSDVFRIEGTAGMVLRVAVSAPAPSDLQGHVAVFDDGRGGDAPGDDYVKVAAGESPTVELLAMDSGGYFVAVRDARNVAGDSVGGSSFGYEIVVSEHETDAYEGSSLSFPSQFDDSLSHASGLRLHGFDGTSGADIIVDLQAQGDMDGRLMIYAEAIESWIARNDDRSLQDTDPLIDAFLTESGPMWLVVENVDEQATALSYTLDVSMP